MDICQIFLLQICFNIYSASILKNTWYFYMVWFVDISWLVQSAVFDSCGHWYCGLQWWYNTLDSHLSLQINLADGGVYCSWLFTCFMKVHTSLYWIVIKPYIYHGVPMLKTMGLPEMRNPILSYMLSGMPFSTPTNHD